MMKTRIMSAAIGALLLGGATLANAGPLDDLFRLLPHPEVRAEQRDDHGNYMAWHRESRDMVRYRQYQRTNDRDRWHDNHRFDARHDHDRNDHPSFDRHDRDDHPRFGGHDHDGR
jgi:hypothetical protein